MSVRYEIEEGTNAVKVFYDDSTVPSLYQPNWPGGDQWADAAEAEAWANLYVASVTDDAAPYAPNHPGETGAPKPTAEQLKDIEDAQKAIQDATTPEDRQVAQEALDAIFKSMHA
jgi:hypothetical protein